jgi:hypothetical protein
MSSTFDWYPFADDEPTASAISRIALHAASHLKPRYAWSSPRSSAGVPSSKVVGQYLSGSPLPFVSQAATNAARVCRLPNLAETYAVSPEAFQYRYSIRMKLRFSSTGMSWS